MKTKKLTALLLAAALLLTLAACSRFNPSSDGFLGRDSDSAVHTSPITGDKPSETPSESPSASPSAPAPAPELEDKPISYFGVSLRLPKGFTVADEQASTVTAVSKSADGASVTLSQDGSKGYFENEGTFTTDGPVEYKPLGGVDAAVVTGADRCEVTLFLRTRTVTVSYAGSFDGGSAVCAASAETLRVGEEEMPPALAASAPEVLAAAGLEETACTFCGYCMNLPKGYTVSEPGPEMTLAEAPNGRDCVTFQTADGSAKNTGRSAFDRTLRETIPGYGGITAFQTGKLNDVLDATFLSFNADISGETASVTQFWLFGPYRDPILVTVTQYGDDGHDALAAAIDTIRPAPPRSVSAEELTGSGGAALELTEDAHVFSGVRMNLPLGMTVSETLLGDIGVMPNGEGPTFAFAVLPTETDKSPIRVASFYTRFDGFEALASNEVVQLGGTAASVSSAETSDGPVVMALVYFPDRCVQIVGRDAQPDTLRACFATLAVG